MLEVGPERDMDEHRDQMERARRGLATWQRHTVLDGPEAGFRPATVVRFRKGRVIQMQQYRSRQDALADTR